MKFTKRLVLGAAIAMVVPQVGLAAIGYRAAVISELQFTAKIAPTDTPVVHVAQSGSWSGSVDCPLDWAYFNSEMNQHLTATVLAAGIGDKVVRIYVDDSLPKLNGFCQVKYISLLPAT